MRKVEIKGKAITADTFLLCVPLVGTNIDEVLSEIKLVKQHSPDVYEWRVDFFTENITASMPKIKEAIGSAALLCTLRTDLEGSNKSVEDEDYMTIVTSMIEAGCDIIDLELSRGELLAPLVKLAKRKAITTIVSKHDFDGTPDGSKIMSTLYEMITLDADIPKLAYMAENKKDAARLMAVAATAEKIAPFIMLSMGEHGKITRVAGKTFGSCMTFVSGKANSAPGQIEIEDAQGMIAKLY